MIESPGRRSTRPNRTDRERRCPGHVGGIDRPDNGLQSDRTEIRKRTSDPHDQGMNKSEAFGTRLRFWPWELVREVASLRISAGGRVGSDTNPLVSTGKWVGMDNKRVGCADVWVVRRAECVARAEDRTILAV